MRQKCQFVTPHVGDHPTKPNQKYCVTFVFPPSPPDATIKNIDRSLPSVAKKQGREDGLDTLSWLHAFFSANVSQTFQCNIFWGNAISIQLLHSSGRGANLSPNEHDLLPFFVRTSKMTERDDRNADGILIIFGRKSIAPVS